jgi:hypothetical protein
MPQNAFGSLQLEFICKFELLRKEFTIKKYIFLEKAIKNIKILNFLSLQMKNDECSKKNSIKSICCKIMVRKLWKKMYF